ELLDLMKRSGCVRVYLGLESVNQETLDGYQKSQSVEDIVKAIDILHEYGINSHGMFVLGADEDTKHTVRDTVDFALKHRIDTVMLNILTPLPGTPQFDRLEEEGRIFDKRWHLYDAHHVVFTPKNMTPYELQSEVVRGYMRFYSKRQWLKLLVTLRFTKLLFCGWGVWIVRAWRKDARNKAFIEALKRLPGRGSWHLPNGATGIESGGM
ncbi:MAG: radical SAM protein, partial [Thermoleophilia bacterium]|nr:radical SAM protein [Thermoleophilia bacterium]